MTNLVFIAAGLLSLITEGRMSKTVTQKITGIQQKAVKAKFKKINDCPPFVQMEYWFLCSIRFANLSKETICAWN